jgi:hypothetical protein
VPTTAEKRRHDGENIVAVDQLAFARGEYGAVGVTIERHPQVRGERPSGLRHHLRIK